jgi:hypothetical protein
MTRVSMVAFLTLSLLAAPLAAEAQPAAKKPPAAHGAANGRCSIN